MNTGLAAGLIEACRGKLRKINQMHIGEGCSLENIWVARVGLCSSSGKGSRVF